MKKITILLTLFTIICSTLFAAPSRRIPKEIVQPDGTTITVIRQGDEHFNYYTTTDNILLKRNADGYFYYAEVTQNGTLKATSTIANNPERRDITESTYIQQYNNQEAKKRLSSHHLQKSSARLITNNFAGPIQTRGETEINIPVILVEFQDVSFSESDAKSKFERRLNEEGYKEDNYYGSVRDYFYTQSNGQFTPTLNIIGPVKTEKEAAYYGANSDDDDDVNVREMVKEACEKAKALGVDFSIYDNNGDGRVDMVYIIYAGKGENGDGTEDDIWPHQWNLLPGDLELDGVGIYTYACSNELFGNRIEGIGTLCHEFTHCLGLPDFYDTKGDNFGMSYWSLMDAGCYCNNGYTPCGYTGYELDFLGWKELKELNSPVTVSLKAMSEKGQAYRIMNENDENEYFVVENRQKTGWDSKLYGNGLMITYVNYNVAAWNNNTVNVGSLRRMTIMPADNDAAEEEKSDLYGDLYPGPTKNTAFDEYSAPAARWNNGSYTNKPITNITEGNNIVTFDFMGGGEIISNIQTYNNKNIYAKSNTIFIYTEKREKFNIYSIDGILKNSFISNTGENSITVTEGIYIIQSENETFKIAVKP